MNKRQEQKQQTRERLLAVARHIFQESGYEGATMARIAAAAGVSAGTVCAHFADKPSLVAATFHRDIEQTLEQAWGSLPARAPIQRQLLHLAGVFYRYYARDPALSRTLLQVSLFLEGPWGLEVQQQAQDFIARVAALLAQAQQRGELAPGVNPHLAAQSFFAHYLLVLQAGLGQALPSPEAQLQHLEQLLQNLKLWSQSP